jgi:tRNA(adenine34) deaminase
MKQALKLAYQAFEDEEVPIGAIVVADNQIIGKGYNQVKRLNDPTAHAEVLAITAASAHLGSSFLNECSLYTTVEPCLMCFGAIENARIKRLYFGCHEPKTGFTSRLEAKKSIATEAGILSEECMSLMKEFFVTKR